MNYEFTPEFCYMLGFLWGDGWVRSSERRGPHQVGFEIVSEDFKEVFPVFERLFKWKVLARHRKDRRPTNIATVNGLALAGYLGGYNYTEKALDASVLEVIPKPMWRYWLRGLVDADGHIVYKNQSTGGGKYKSCGICIYGPLDQDWTSILKVFEFAGVNPIIRKRNRNTGQGSELVVMDRKATLKIGRLIYSGETFGLTRKKQKMELIKEYDITFS